MPILPRSCRRVLHAVRVTGFWLVRLIPPCAHKEFRSVVMDSIVSIRRSSASICFLVCRRCHETPACHASHAASRASLELNPSENRFSKAWRLAVSGLGLVFVGFTGLALYHTKFVWLPHWFVSDSTTALFSLPSMVRRNGITTQLQERYGFCSFARCLSVGHVRLQLTLFHRIFWTRTKRINRSATGTRPHPATAFVSAITCAISNSIVVCAE